VQLGAGRSYAAVAAKFGVSKRAVTKRAEKEGWQKRVAELETKARQAVEKRAVESLEQMNERHLLSLKVVQGKALEALRKMPLDSAIDAVRALDLGIRQERLIRGEPSDRTAISVEDTIRSEYQKWLVKDGDEPDQ
jgi:carbamoylphosphate synthase small subunit